MEVGCLAQKEICGAVAAAGALAGVSLGRVEVAIRAELNGRQWRGPAQIPALSTPEPLPGATFGHMTGALRRRPQAPPTPGCGRSSGVEHNLAKVGVVSSNLIARSSFH